MSIAAYIIAAALFALCALGVEVGDLTTLRLTAAGLAVFALAHVLP